MRHGYTSFNQSVNILTEYGLSKMPYAQVLCTVKKVLYGTLFWHQLPVPRGRTVTVAFIKNVLKKLRAHFKRRRPKTGLKYFRLLHDSAPAHKARIVTEFLESEKVNVLHIPLFQLTWLPVTISCFPKSNSICLEKDIYIYKSKNSLGSVEYQFLMGVPIQD